MLFIEYATDANVISLVDLKMPQKQSKYQTDHLKPWQFQPGKSGNPGGKPVGTKSLKTYAKEFLLSLSDEEKIEYMKGMDKKDIWEMAEGKAKQDIEANVEVTTKIISVDE